MDPRRMDSTIDGSDTNGSETDGPVTNGPTTLGSATNGLGSGQSADAAADGRGGGRVRRLARLFARFGPLLRPHHRQLQLAIVMMLGYIAMDLMAPWPFSVVVDGVLLGRRNHGVLARIGGWLPADPMVLLAVCCLAVVLITTLRGMFDYGQNLLTATVGHRVVSDLRVAVFGRLQRLSLAFHSHKRSGDLLVRLTGDVSLLREILVPAVLETVTRLLVLAGMLAFMSIMDPLLTLIAVAMMPVLAVLTVRFGSRIREVSREQRRKEGRIASVAGEALASVAVVQAYSREENVAARFSRQNAKSLTAGLRSLRLEESLARSVELTLAVGSCLVLWIGARRSLAGSLSPGELIVFLTYLRGIYKPIQALVRIAGRASKAVACGERVMEVLDSREEVRESPTAIPAPPLRGEIVFDRVTFGYEPGRPVLHGISFRIAPGEKVGLVGPSGSGKATILALLLRLHDPQQGRILVDGKDIRLFKLESYRLQIAIVLQEPFLFGVSVEENIRQGRSDASPAEILEAARAAGAHEFIEALPQGYETELGERGASLSRGQQQRISLARAVLRGAPVMVFDEPTTGLDARTEAGVLETLSPLGRGKTRLSLAHQLNQILDCPRVLVIRDGRLEQAGH